MKDEHQATALFSLKMRQLNLGTSLMQMREVPLAQEVLREKHLATYFGTVRVGNTDFRVLFDTGSCEFWIPSSECNTERCHRHAQFPVTDSTRLNVDPNANMNIQYLSGKVTGDMVYETVGLGDIQVPRQEVGMADVVDITLLDDVVWDGILGLAYPTDELVTKGVTPLFDTMIDKKVLTSQGLANQFAYYINDKGGSMTFGGANCDLIVPPDTPASECIAKFNFVPVTEKSYWTVKLADVRFQYPGQPAVGGNCPSGGCKAIVDTGTYLLYGPSAQVHRIINGGISDCSDYTQMPNIIFDFDMGYNNAPLSLTLRPIDYILKFQMNQRDDCVVGISPDQDTIWTLGQVFLRSFYTIFDRDSDRVGFAHLERDHFEPITGDNPQYAQLNRIAPNMVPPNSNSAIS